MRANKYFSHKMQINENNFENNCFDYLRIFFNDQYEILFTNLQINEIIVREIVDENDNMCIILVKGKMLKVFGKFITNQKNRRKLFRCTTFF